MPSLISWLDASTAETDKMRELVKLFSQPETLDDLGVGQVRDVISNSLFPGTSTLHLGARYLILVPWAYLSSRASGLPPERMRTKVNESERRLIEHLFELGEKSFIGSAAGSGVLTLPSAVYWSALRKFAIVDPSVERASSFERMCNEPPSGEGEQTNGMWWPTMPAPPVGFPESDTRGLNLSAEEAQWIRERILSTCPDTLLSHLVASSSAPADDSRRLWLDPLCLTAQGETARWIEDAQAFSLIHNGASILYQRLLAEAGEAAFGGFGDALDATGGLLDEWELDRSTHMHLLHSWDTDAFLNRIKAANPGTRPGVLSFTAILAQAVMRPAKLTDNQLLREAVRLREMAVKMKNSRFRNEGRLRAWEAPSSVGALTFRWTQAKRTVTDIHNGLHQETEPAHV